MKVDVWGNNVYLDESYQRRLGVLLRLRVSRFGHGDC